MKCIFDHDGLANKPDGTVYEERVVILRATGLEDAIVQGEDEAREYESISDSSIRYAGFISAYHTGMRELSNRMEVYSLMRESMLSREEFLDRYHDDGDERTQHYQVDNIQ